jgi:hypothetical protein
LNRCSVISQSPSPFSSHALDAFAGRAFHATILVVVPVAKT